MRAAAAAERDRTLPRCRTKAQRGTHRPSLPLLAWLTPSCDYNQSAASQRICIQQTWSPKNPSRSAGTWLPMPHETGQVWCAAAPERSAAASRDAVKWRRVCKALVEHCIHRRRRHAPPAAVRVHTHCGRAGGRRDAFMPASAKEVHAGNQQRRGATRVHWQTAAGTATGADTARGPPRRDQWHQLFQHQRQRRQLQTVAWGVAATIEGSASPDSSARRRTHFWNWPRSATLPRSSSILKSQSPGQKGLRKDVSENGGGCRAAGL